MSCLRSPDLLEWRLGEPGLVLLEVSFFTPGNGAWVAGRMPGPRHPYRWSLGGLLLTRLGEYVLKVSDVSLTGWGSMAGLPVER